MNKGTSHAVGMLVVVGTLSFIAGMANATQYTWNTGGSLSPGSGTDCAGPGTVKCKTTFTSTSGGLTLTAQSYSTHATSGTGSANWDEANIATYSGGIGISNVHDSNDTSVPYHAIDNSGVKDVLVFELPTGYTWNPNAFKIGWEYTTAEGKPNSFSADSDVKAYIGNTEPAGGGSFDFRNACFSATNCAGTTLASLGFTDITPGIPVVSGGTMSPDGASAAGGQNVPANVSVPLNTLNTGRYLVLSGDLTSSNDFFKINQLIANGVTQVPAPGTLALFALGLLLLFRFRGHSRPASLNISLR